MNHRIHDLMRAFVVSVLAIGLFAPEAVSQADGALEGNKVAIVSLARLQLNYGELRAREENLGHWLEERRARYNELANYVFLSQKDFEEAVELIEKPRPRSEENQQRLRELRDVSDERDQRFSDLRAKPERSAQEAAEFNTLQETYDARAETLQSMQQQIIRELSQRRDTEVEGLMGRVQDAIVDTAEALGYSIVLDADAVFFGGYDITDEVLQRLNYGTERPVVAPGPEEAANDEGADNDEAAAQDGDGAGDD